MRTSSGIDASLAVMPEGWPRTKALLTEAIKLPKDDRGRFIAAACRSEPKLQEELLSILDSYDTATRVCGPAWTGGTTLGALVPSLASLVQKKSEPVLTVDATYGPYRVLKQLGVGGMGEVFLAQDVRLGRRVAMKSLAGPWLESPTARQRLMREARSAAALTHPHIATLYDVLEDAGHLLLVMEYVEGRAASSLLEDGPIPLGHALRLAIQIADAVSYAHDRGIIHCDIKPANVQVAVDGTAKVLDFGLARAKYDPGDSDEVTSSEQGKLIGTLGYMAPERIVEGTFNASGDIYSLGVVIFEMVTGRRFFDGRDLSDFLLMVLGSHVPKPSSAVAGLPVALDEVVERALAKKPMLRYHSARELSRDLRAVLASLDGSAAVGATDVSATVQPKPWAVQHSHAWITPVAIAALLLAVLTLAGSVASIVFNQILGRDYFIDESPLVWLTWGYRAMVAPSALLVGGAVSFALLTAGCRLLLATCEPVRRWHEPTRRAVHAAFISTSGVALAEALLVANIATLVVLVWRFSNLLAGLSRIHLQGFPEHFAVLAPGNRPEQNLYRQILSIELFVFSLAWYLVLRLLVDRNERGRVPLLAGGLAALIVTICLLAAPYRIVYHNDAERVSYRSQPCYLVGRRADDALLFCPFQPPPWNRIVGVDDPALKLEPTVENIFAEVDRTH